MDFPSVLKVLAQISDFRGGVLVFGFFSQAFNILGLLLMFGLGLKLLQFTWYGKGLFQNLCNVRRKSIELKTGFCSKQSFYKACDSKSENNVNSLVGKEFANANTDIPDDDYEREHYVEDEEFDVMALRRLVKIERLRAKKAFAELEEERMAAASAANEAMAMILRLQREKSSIEIEANQYHKMAEQKQEYDQEVIQSLQWIIMKHESERIVLEEKLRSYKLKLKQHMKNIEVDQFEDATVSSVDSIVEDDHEDVPNNLVEMDP